MVNHGDRKSPKDRVVGPLPNGRNLWLKQMGVMRSPLNHPLGAHPPNKPLNPLKVKKVAGGDPEIRRGWL